MDTDWSQWSAGGPKGQTQEINGRIPWGGNVFQASHKHHEEIKVTSEDEREGIKGTHSIVRSYSEEVTLKLRHDHGWI